MKKNGGRKSRETVSLKEEINEKYFTTFPAKLAIATFLSKSG
jgi:hypothetical protein